MESWKFFVHQVYQTGLVYKLPNALSPRQVDKSCFIFLHSKINLLPVISTWYRNDWLPNTKTFPHFLTFSHNTCVVYQAQCIHTQQITSYPLLGTYQTACQLYCFWTFSSCRVTSSSSVQYFTNVFTECYDVLHFQLLNVQRGTHIQTPVKPSCISLFKAHKLHSSYPSMQSCHSHSWTILSALLTFLHLFHWRLLQSCSTCGLIPSLKGFNISITIADLTHSSCVSM